MMKMRLRALASVALLAHCSYAQCEDETCRWENPQAKGASLLQTKSNTQKPQVRAMSVREDRRHLVTIGAMLKQDTRNQILAIQELSKEVSDQPGACQLPPGAAWCEVRLANLAPYFMAVYDQKVAPDVVSGNICNKGFWEDFDMSAFGQPGSMLDIGGNIGYHTFAFAQAGWTVNTFEPMAPNLAMIQATMCRNPELASRIHIHAHGLGTTAQQCRMMAPAGNVGDGFTKCGAPGEMLETQKFKEIGVFAVLRLDQVLTEQNITQVDIVKIDVEGYEYQVFAGAPNFLAEFHPRLVKSEVWNNMVGASGAEYLAMFENAGYKLFSDTRCTVPVTPQNRTEDVIMCNK